LSGTEIALIITAVTGLIVQLINVWNLQRNTKDLRLVEKNSNSMKDALVSLTEKESYARGVKSEVDKQ